MSGWTAVLWLAPLAIDPASRWRFGLDNYGGDLPSQTLSGDAQGWAVRETAWGVQAQWFFLPSVPALFAGSFLLTTHWQYRIGDEQTATWRLGVMPEAGYQWFPALHVGWEF